MILMAVPVNAEKIEIDITFRAKLEQWKELRRIIIETRARGMHGSDSLDEPFWSIVYRLDAVIATVERQHTNYNSGS